MADSAAPPRPAPGVAPSDAADAAPLPDRRLGWITLLLAVLCGLSAANLYYAQPLLGLLADSFGVAEGRAALVVTVTQVGYAVGLLLLVPLGDLLENRRLAQLLLAGAAISLAAVAASPSLGVFLVASLAVGLTSVVAQVLVPLAAHLAPPGREGSVVGRVMSGLLLGILLARTMSSLIAEALGWRAVYAICAAVMLGLALIAARALPHRRPTGAPRYPALIASLWEILRHEPVLRVRAAYQFLMFGMFSAFWTSIAYLLSDRHGLSQAGIGIFALVGAAGAAAAPIAGRLADHGHSRLATGAGLLIGALAMAATWPLAGSLVGLAAAAVILDLAVQTTMVVSQRTIYAIRPQSRARINALFLSTMFVGGALGSALSGALYGAVGWGGVAVAGAAMALTGFLTWLVRAGR